MAQPNVAREPSMEEILASIRRIIESNEPEEAGMRSSADETMEASDSGAVSHEPQPETAELSHDETDDDSDIQLTVDGTFDDATVAEEKSVSPQQAPAEEAAKEPSKPNSLADVAARVRAGAESARQVPNSPLVTAQMQGLSAGSIGARKLDAEVEVSATMPAATTAAPVTASSVAPQNIVSKATETKVSQSFDDLVAALNAKPQRSLDELAEEMLRPMLRDWLDNNLPQLVERLVREEIERVARGPKG